MNNTDTDTDRSERQSRTSSCDSDRVCCWTDLAGDRNPLHLDPESAAETRFGVPIVPGHLLACVLVDGLQASFGDRHIGHRQVSIRFRALVPVSRDIIVDYYPARGSDVAVHATCDGTDIFQVEVAPPETPETAL